ncbi:MAG: sigma factor [Deltaproteobacteria bacterium]|nr:sigma factor [Deltaproteobacteria bacterium]
MTTQGTPSAKHEVLARALTEHRGALRAFVRARVEPHDVDDVLQAATLKATEHLDALEDPTKIRAWLFRIVRNTLTDAHRARASRRALVYESAALAALPESSAATPCGCGITLADSLPPQQSAVLRLVDLGDATLSEAADSLGITVNNATVRLHRARRGLRERLKQHCGVLSARDCNDCACVSEACSAH